MHLQLLPLSGSNPFFAHRYIPREIYIIPPPPKRGGLTEQRLTGTGLSPEEEARSVRMREAGREVEDGWVTQYWPELSITL